MRQVTVGLIQLETKLGDKEYNLALAQKKVREAAEKGARIICLPELFVTGYNLGAFGERLYDMAEGLSGPAVTRCARLQKSWAFTLLRRCASGIHHAPAEQCRGADKRRGRSAGRVFEKPFVRQRVRLFYPHGRIPRIRDEVRQDRHDDMR